MSDEPDADGNDHIDPEKLMAEAARLAGQLTEWETDSVNVEVHPIQQAP
ncbi:hypothetical protein [Amycolatopsis sp. WGS_07]